MFSSQQQDTGGTMPWNRFVTTYSSDYKPPFGDQHPWVTQMMLRAAPAAYSLSQTVGTKPWERFVTTYSSDYKPFSEQHPQVPQMVIRADAAPETTCETCPRLLHHFYKTTNSSSGPSGFSQTGKQEAGVNSETRVSLSKEDEGRLHYGAELEEQKAKEKPQNKFDILFEEGVTVTCPVSPACCKYFVRCVCREAGQQDLLHLPVISAPSITVNAAESWNNSSILRGLNPMSSTFLQPTTMTCSCFSQEVVCPYRDCIQFQRPPSDSKHTPSQVQPTVYSRKPSRDPWVTEYQASYCAGRF